MIDEAVLQRTLQTALRDGGDFAEVFAEDRRVASARLDDAKVEELVSGRERGAGIRVVRGDTTGYAHTADLSEAGLRAAADGGRGRGPGHPGHDPRRRARAARRSRRTHEVQGAARDGRRRPARPRCSSAPTTPPAPRATRSAR